MSRSTFTLQQNYTAVQGENILIICSPKLFCFSELQLDLAAWVLYSWLLFEIQ